MPSCPFKRAAFLFSFSRRDAMLRLYYERTNHAVLTEDNPFRVP